MDCPRCNSSLTARTRGGIEIDTCEKCGGIWLDKGELGKLFELERGRSDEEIRANWRMYDRGRDSYEPAPQVEKQRGMIEELLGEG
jgi:Zn-finger nucleic acid-binding protein